MTKDEKYAGAILALKMIAKVKPHQEYYETGYNCGGHKDCEQCRKMIDMATSALEELLKEYKDD